MKLPSWLTARRIYLALLLLVATLLSLTVVILPLVQESLILAPVVGQVAARDYRAARAASYVSEIRTDRARASAEQSVLPIYTAPDTRVARRQMEQLRAALAYITNVRSDPFAATEQKLADLAALEEVNLNPLTARTAIELNDTRWQEVQQGALSLLERLMSTAIRPETLLDARQRAPSLVSLSFPEDQAALVAELAAAFVAPNSRYSESLTNEARQKAREAVEPVTRNFIQGQTVVQQGEVLDAEDVEALYKLGLVQAGRSSQEISAAILATLLMVAFVAFYAQRKQVIKNATTRRVAVIVVLLMLFLSFNRTLLTVHSIVPYVFPIAAYALTITALYGLEIALVTSLPLAILSAYGLSNALELTIYFIISGAFGGLALGRARRLLSFLIAGIAVGASGLWVLVIYRLPNLNMQSSDWVTLATAALISGFTSTSIALLLHTLLARFLDMVTAMQLVDLTRPDQPLLRKLLQQSPGTYQHSLQVANLAEQAAERIGADALLTRVGALYHDIGKTIEPAYYIENQPPGFANPHDALTPEESAQKILLHVGEGLALGKKSGLPQRVLDFVSEHHGNGVMRFQYGRAVQAAGGDESKVDRSQYCYPGPRPQSRETAILMLADGCEARVRAERPATDEAMRSIIKSVIANRANDGQLNDTNLTLNDLDMIGESFFATLRGFYHPRLDYPKLEKESPNHHDQDTQPNPNRSLP
jgi:putative nucleotidyltransferase with HDIG domain